MRLCDYSPHKHIFRRVAVKRTNVSQFLDVRRVGSAKCGYDWVCSVEPPSGFFGATAKGESFSSFHTRSITV